MDEGLMPFIAGCVEDDYADRPQVGMFDAGKVVNRASQKTGQGRIFGYVSKHVL